MRRVVAQIEDRANGETSSRADVAKVLMEVRSRCADREPVPKVDGDCPGIVVRMPREKLVSALTHLVRNAQDATPAGGDIRITVMLHQKNRLGVWLV